MKTADATSRRSPSLRAFGIVTVLASVLMGDRPLTGTQTTQSPPSNPSRVAEMRHHYGDVALVHEALIRGDLAAVREPAERLSRLRRPADLPAVQESFLEAIRVASRRVMESPTIGAAASATASMVSQCGECHRAVNIRPAPAGRAMPDVGGQVGHMLEHQRAADQLLLGLVMPSAALWRQGLDGLAGASLRPGDFPSDPKLTAAIRAAEVALHEAARSAVADPSVSERADSYGRVLMQCAACHGLHPRIWGPRTAP